MERSKGNAFQHSTADAFMSSSHLVGDDDIAIGETSLIKAELLTAVERLSPRLPPNTLDQLIVELGGPQYVAEVTFYNTLRCSGIFHCEGW